jgi:CDP-diacylglycerol--serine O-phosphatidyltransferase
VIEVVDRPLGPADDVLEPRLRMRRFRRVPLRIILPNLVTLLALCLGLTAIRFAAEGHFENAVLAIIGAAVLDGLDGRLARALRGATRFGAELDSLADFIDFGVAPALLLWFWTLHQVPGLGWFAALVFAIAGALRLARFNVMLDDPTRPAWSANFFVGMPAPAGAIVALLPMYLGLAGLDFVTQRWFVPVEIAYLLGVAFLMASRIPHFSGKKIGRVPREYVIFVLFGVAACMLLIAIYTMEMMAVLSLAYLALVPLAVHRYRELGANDVRAAAEAEAAALTPGAEAPPPPPTSSAF